MKKLTGIIACLLIVLLFVFAEADIALNETNFPDSTFRERLSKNYDKSKDGVLAGDEIPTWINVEGVGNPNLASMEGISLFTGLQSLSCGWNKIGELDLSGNCEIKAVSCSNNKLTKLNVSENASLESLKCSVNMLTSLDISNNPLIKELDCGRNQLTILDIRNNPALTTLYCNENLLTTLDISNNPVLEKLNCYSNQLTELDASHNTSLLDLACHGNQLTELNISSNTALTALTCSENKLISLDISANTSLKNFSCEKNQITVLDVSNNTKLEMIRCENNQMTTLILGSKPSLGILYCNGNRFTELDISKCPNMVDVIQRVDPVIREDGVHYEMYRAPGYVFVVDPGTRLIIDSSGTTITVPGETAYVPETPKAEASVSSLPPQPESDDMPLYQDTEFDENTNTESQFMPPIGIFANGINSAAEHFEAPSFITFEYSEFVNDKIEKPTSDKQQGYIFNQTEDYLKAGTTVSVPFSTDLNTRKVTVKLRYLNAGTWCTYEQDGEEVAASTTNFLQNETEATGELQLYIPETVPIGAYMLELYARSGDDWISARARVFIVSDYMKLFKTENQLNYNNYDKKKTNAADKSTWGDWYYGDSSIKDAGCGLCAIVNSLSYLNGTPYDYGKSPTVHEVRDWAKANVKLGGGGSPPDLYKKFADSNGETYGYKYIIRTTSQKELIHYLKQGCVAIIGIKGPAGQHIISICGYNPENKRFLILDSAGTYSSWTKSPNIYSWQTITNNKFENNSSVEINGGYQIFGVITEEYEKYTTPKN